MALLRSPSPATVRCAAALSLAACLALGSSCRKPSEPTVDAGNPPVANRCDDVSPAAACGTSAVLPENATSSGGVLSVACSAVTVKLSFVEDGILRLLYEEPGTDRVARRKSFAVVGDRPGPIDLRVGESCGRLVACSAGLTAEIDPVTCRVRVTDAKGTVLLDDGTAGGYAQSTERENNGVVPVRSLTRLTPSTEAFYGFGEHTGPFARRGTAMTFFNTDAYVAAAGGWPANADPLYLSIPFFLGLRGDTAYGVFTDNASRVRMDMAATNTETYRISVRHGAVDQYVIAGPSMPEVLRRYTSLTGRIPMPPRWALGYQQSRWGYAPDTQVTEIASEFRRRKIPADGLWLDIQHMRGFRSWTFDPATFADPAGLTAALEAQGFKTVTIVDPGIKQDPDYDVYAEGLADGHFLQRPQGGVFIGKVWPGESAFPDFTSPLTRKWWGGLVPRATDVGVRGLWLDMNEPSEFDRGTVPDELPVEGDGEPSTMGALHNVYGFNEVRATYEGMLAAQPRRRPFLLTRAGYAGSQRYSAAWTGDAPSTWESLQQTPAMLLNLSLSGMPFVGSDVGGYSGHATAELFARWMQVGSISPFFRGHVTEKVNNQEPWAFGTEVEDISREAISRRYRLLPYLYTLFAEASRSGAPILRPLVYEFPGEPGLRTVGDELMLGPWLLYAPVLAQGVSSRRVVLPAGRWFERESNAVFEGPATIEVGVTLAALPTFVREGAVVPSAPEAQHTSAQRKDVLMLDVYPSKNTTEFVLYEDDGESLDHLRENFARTTYSLVGNDEGATLSATSPVGSYSRPSRRLEVRVSRVDHAPREVLLSGQALARVDSLEALAGSSAAWWWDDNDLSLRVAFPEPSGFTLSLRYDPTLREPAPPVRRALRVRLPSGTPEGSIAIASSVNGWQQQPLMGTRRGDVVEGWLEVPRGQWFFYKFTRGDWSSVEKWPGCVEALNRYAFGAAHPDKEDEVFVWADRCP